MSKDRRGHFKNKLASYGNIILSTLQQVCCLNFVSVSNMSSSLSTDGLPPTLNGYSVAITPVRQVTTDDSSFNAPYNDDGNQT